MAKTTRQQLKAAEKLATKFPLFVGELAPELPKLQAHVEAHGNRDMIPEPAAYHVGQRVWVQKVAYDNKTGRAALGTIRRVEPGWSFDGRWHQWYYYVTYDPGQRVPSHTERLPVWPNSNISPLHSSSPMQFTVVGYLGNNPEAVWWSHLERPDKGQAIAAAQLEAVHYLNSPDSTFRGDYDEEEPLTVVATFSGHHYPV